MDKLEFPIKVFIIENHVLLRNALIKYLSAAGGFRDVAGCGGYDEVETHINKEKPDVVLVSIDRKKEKGERIVKLILQHFSNIKIVGISLNNLPNDAIQLMRIGAKGYVTKTSEAIEFKNAILVVARGDIYLCSEIAQKVANGVKRNMT